MKCVEYKVKDSRQDRRHRRRCPREKNKKPFELIFLFPYRAHTNYLVLSVDRFYSAWCRHLSTVFAIVTVMVSSSFRLSFFSYNVVVVSFRYPPQAHLGTSVYYIYIPIHNWCQQWWWWWWRWRRLQRPRRWWILLLHISSNWIESSWKLKFVLVRQSLHFRPF